MKKGFTLIELLVVVLIIGILSAVALPQYSRAVEKSRAAEALTIADAVHKGVALYYLATNSFPSSLDELDIQVSPSKTFDIVLGQCGYSAWGFRVRRLGKGFSAFANDYYELTYEYDRSGKVVARTCSGGLVNM
ncbi:type IV pilin protein [Candidatus Avelusimicrobium alvi]|uniref:type IV pilin protein n=1 Tax=Candidatus Avelusimicrobium alvi TaxID=3416221 RepID=UPI003D0A28D2